MLWNDKGVRMTVGAHTVKKAEAALHTLHILALG